MIPTTVGCRTRSLNSLAVDPTGEYVLYWMQCSQRVRFNYALSEAVAQADALGLGVAACFGLDVTYPDGNARHFSFMLDGLAEVARELASLGIAFVVREGPPDVVCLELAHRAALVVCDRGYLRPHLTWRKRVARNAQKLVLEVESDVVVPVEQASDKREFSARTIRGKLQRAIDDWLEPPVPPRPRVAMEHLPLEGLVTVNAALPDDLRLDRSVGASHRFRGGSSEATRRLVDFLGGGLAGYAGRRNDPAAPQCSNLSPYLHFGHISPVEIVHAVRASVVAQTRTGSEHPALAGDSESFLEELVVRRELSFNYVRYEPAYDRYRSLPDWARGTLEKHRSDPRAVTYRRGALEAAETHDRYWNAAMLEMRKTGYMHNYMRMYWGKKIIEWTKTPAYAFRTALYLNNKYFLDGRDPNSYVGIAWLFGLHDRPWGERPIFGTVRYMAASGLERKFDIEAYAKWVEQL